MSKIVGIIEDVEYYLSRLYKIISRNIPVNIVQSLLFYYLSLIVVFIVLTIGFALAPVDPLSTLMNLLSPSMTMAAMGILTGGLVIAENTKFPDVGYLFRDLMVRIYTIVIYGCILVLFFFTWSSVTSSIQIDTQIQDIGVIWVGLSLSAMLLIYIVRLFPWIRAVQEWLKGLTKQYSLPPYRNDSWHLSTPILDDDNTEHLGYQRPEVEDLEARNLVPAIWRAIFFGIFGLLTLWIEFWFGSQYSNLVPNEQSLEGNGIVIAVQGLGGLVIPRSIISTTLQYFNLTNAQALFIIAVFLVPSMSILVSGWNVSYIGEELQYRLLHRIVGDATVSPDTVHQQLLYLFTYNILLADIILLGGLLALSRRVAGIILYLLLILLLLYGLTHVEVEDMSKERINISCLLTSILAVLPWLLLLTS